MSLSNRPGAGNHFNRPPPLPILTRRSIASLQELAVFMETWAIDAREAEEAGNHQKAFELYTRIGNIEGRRRTANSPAKELETSGFNGSVIEYFEKGGNHDP